MAVETEKFPSTFQDGERNTSTTTGVIPHYLGGSESLLKGADGYGSNGEAHRQAQEDATRRQEMARARTIVARPVAEVAVKNC